MDDIGSFGSDFKGFPKHLPEDTVEYTLFIIGSSGQGSQDSRAELESVLAAACSLVQKLLQEYLWQREAFELESSHVDGHLCLHGQTNYGDSIEDEWVIVYLLRELTKAFADLWIKVNDADGEFLLVEAANALPHWLVPEVAENRVWMHRGQLFIIPIEPASNLEPSARRLLSTGDAIDLISTRSESLLHLPEVESEAFYRLRNYPDQISRSLHHALVVIPRKLACILNLKPELISPAVEAFYLRDPISLKPLQEEAKRNQSMLLFPPEDLVTMSVRFSKIGYAQLMGQHFAPPPAWSGVFANKDQAWSSSRLETGMKITSGFEMLVTDPQNQEKEPVMQIRRISSAIAKREISLPSDSDIAGWDKTQDDEGWLDIDFADLENELSRKSDDQESKSRTFGDKNAQENLRKLVQRFESFLNDESAGIDGVEELGDDDDGSVDSDGTDGGSGEEAEDVSFNEADFTKMMREMMGLPPESAGGESERLAKQATRSDVESEHDQDDNIQDIMKRMEAELHEAGALGLDPPPQPPPRKLAAAVKEPPEAGPSSRKDAVLSRDIIRIEPEARGEEAESLSSEKKAEVEDESDLDGKEVDVDYNLAKNLLESFKGQSGLPGPSGNVLASLGFHLPRDEDDEDEDEDEVRPTRK